MLTATSTVVSGANFTTEPSCYAPTDLSVSNITDTSAKLNWTDNYNTNSKYIVEWRETGTSTWNSATAPIHVMIYQD